MGSRAALLALVAGCYSPRLKEGAPCETTQDCPSAQQCVLGSCVLRGLHDGAIPDGPVIDAPIDGRPDAAPLACETAGLTCSGTPIVFECGGHCWARCPGAATRAAASAACTGWLGALGEIDDATEQTCVAMKVGTDLWLGLVQSDSATSPGRDWYWNTPTVPVVYSHWQAGKPDDNDGRENLSEQCAKIQGDGTWDDVECNAMTGFLCERGLTR